MLIDTHAHFANPRLLEDLPDVLARAAEAGVHSFVAPAIDLASARELLDLTLQQPAIRPAVGVHPCDAHSVSTTDLHWLEELRSMAARPEVAAIGELGLDFFHPPPEGYTHEAWSEQQHRVATPQLDLAAELGMNVIVHTRNSHAEMLAAIRPYTGRLRAVFHCFTGTAEEAAELADLGHLVSFTGNVTYKKAPIIQDTAQKVPAGTFMLETDSPFLAPEPHRGKRCEPAFVADTARFVASLRGESLESLAAHTSATARSFFRNLA